MSAFGNTAPGEVIDAAEKFITKMDERRLAQEIEQSERAMNAAARIALVEALFDAFRQRGESSEDVVEAAGVRLDEAQRGEPAALRALLLYARENPGSLKETAIAFIERQPALTGALGSAIADGIAARLTQR